MDTTDALMALRATSQTAGQRYGVPMLVAVLDEREHPSAPRVAPAVRRDGQRLAASVAQVREALCPTAADDDNAAVVNALAVAAREELRELS